jgi:DNA-binding MarR family transcriptional regulator
VVVPELSSRDFENLLAFRNGLRRFLRWSESRAREVGMTPAQHQLLVAVKGHRGGGPPTISDLAGYLLLRHHSVVELVDRAVAAGLVTRQPDARDGRVTRIGLTAEGEERLSRLALAHLDELRSLAPVLDHLVADWAAHTDPPPPAAGRTEDLPERRRPPRRVLEARRIPLPS